MKTFIGDELVTAVLANFKEKTFRIEDEQDLVCAFFEAKNNTQFKEFFKNYPFDTDGLEPICSKINDALATLQQSRLLGRMNPDLVDYVISEAIENRFSEITETENERKEIRELASFIENQLNGTTAAL